MHNKIGLMSVWYCAYRGRGICGDSCCVCGARMKPVAIFAPSQWSAAGGWNHPLLTAGLQEPLTTHTHRRRRCFSDFPVRLKARYTNQQSRTRWAIGRTRCIRLNWPSRRSGTTVRRAEARAGRRVVRVGRWSSVELAALAGGQR